MCATKPSMSWPHSPSRTSSSDCALLGIRSSPRHGLVAGQQLGAVGVRGDRDRPGVRDRHRHRAHGDDPRRRRAAPATSRTARANASQRLSGSGPCSRRYGVPPLSWQQPDHQPRRVVGLVVVADERHRPGDGPGSRGTGRRRRWRRPARAVGTGRGRRGAGRRAPRRCRRRGSRRGPAPSSGRRPPSARGPRRRCARDVRWPPVQLSQTPLRRDVAVARVAVAVGAGGRSVPGSAGRRRHRRGRAWHGRLEVAGAAWRPGAPAGGCPARSRRAARRPGPSRRGRGR